MTHLLKPNDGGLASLDDVRAWMEAQARDTIEEKVTSSAENKQTTESGKEGIKWIGEYCFFDLIDRTPTQWETLLEYDGLRPILLSEIYALAKEPRATHYEDEAFEWMKALINARRLLTGTTYDTQHVFNEHNIQKHQLLTIQRYHTLFTDSMTDILPTQAFFGTDDNSKTIRETFSQLITGAQHMEYVVTTQSPGHIHVNKRGEIALATYFGKNMQSIGAAISDNTYGLIGVRK